MSRRILILWLCLLAPSLASGVTLESLLAGMDDGARVEAMEAERQRLTVERQYRADERGWSLFGGANGGHFRELEPPDNRIGYTGYGAEIGLRYPLLGTLRRRTEAVEKADLAVARQQYEVALQRAGQRLAIRMTYADWWHAETVAQWCADLRADARDELAGARERARHRALRTSELQWLEQRWSRVLRACDTDDSQRGLLRSRLGRLAGVRPDALDRAERPALSARAAPIEHWITAINQHPAVKAGQAALATAADLKDGQWYDRIDSSFRLSQQFDRRTDIRGTGTGLAAGFTFEVPLGALNDSAASELGKARYRAARQRLRAQRDELLTDVENALVAHQDTLDDVTEAREQLALAQQVEQERSLRTAVDTEAGYMALRTARVAEAESYLNLLRAWRSALQSQSDLRTLADHADTGTPLLSENTVPWPTNHEPEADRGGRWMSAAYVWDSAPLLDPEQRQTHLSSLAGWGFNHIYLGLDARQISNLADLERHLRALAEAAGKRGIAVSLLLGEPLWLTDRHRKDLRRLIEKLDHLPFAGLHLDLEVEQMGWPVPPQRLAGWLETVETAVETSPWPVSLVSHHRWFTASAQSGHCVPCGLEELGVNRISVMIYTTNTDRIRELAHQATTRWPDLGFAVTQSVEASLPATESWHGYGSGTLRENAGTLAAELQEVGVTGLEWQDWAGHPAAPSSQPDR